MKKMKFTNSMIRVKLKKDIQRKIFKNFIKRFDTQIEAAKFLRLTKSNIHAYSHRKTRYSPNKIIRKIENKIIVYEINASKRSEPAFSLAGKILYIKSLLKNVKCITILESFENLKDTYPHRRLNHISGIVLTGKSDKDKLISARNEVLGK